MSSQSLNTEQQHRIISSPSSSSSSSFVPPSLSPSSSSYRNRKHIQQSNRHYPQDSTIEINENEKEDRNDHRHCHDAFNDGVLITKTTRTTTAATNYPTLLSIRSWIIASRIEKYYSIRIDRASNHRTVHILPENYQFCSWAKKFPQKIDINTSDVRCHQLFGICSAADVHFGKCSNFEPFVEAQAISISPTATIGTNNLFYTIKTNSGSRSDTGSSMVVNNKKYYINRFPNENDNYSAQFPQNDQQMYPLATMISPPSSPIDRSMVRSRIETYRENLSAALELLTFADDEPNELEDLIRNFVREDRLRQGPRIQSPGLQTIDNGIDQHSRHQSPDRFASQKNDDQSRPLSPTSSDIDTRGRRILLKKAQAEKIFQNGGQIASNQNQLYSRNDPSSATSPFLSTNREGVVQSRLLRFSNHNSQRPSSPTPFINGGKNHFTPINEFDHCSINNTSTASTSITSSTSEQSSTNRTELNHKNGTTIEKTVFGMNPKSSSLARNKKLIEARNENSLPIQQNFATGIDLNQLSSLNNTIDHGDSGNKRNINNKRNNLNNHQQAYFGNGTPTSPPTSSIMKNFQFDGGNIGKISTAIRSQPNQHHLSDNETDIDNILNEMANNSLDTSHFKNNKKSSSSSSSSSSFSRDDGGNSSIHSSNMNGTDVIDTTNDSNSSFYHSSSFSSSSSPSSSFPYTPSSSLKLSPQTSGAILLTSTTPTTTSLQSNIFGSGSKFQVESSSVSLSSTPKTPTAPTTTAATDISSSWSPASPLLDFVARNQLQPVNNSSASLFNHSSINEQQSGTTPNNDNNENTIDTFIKENENFFKSGHRLSRSLSLIENSNDYSPPSIDSIVEMKTKNSSSTLTDDEKALLDETLKMGGIYGGSSSGGSSGNSLSSSTSGIDTIDSSKSPDSTDSTPQQPPKRRIIFVSKPAPKPEPKPEPKYVNGKVVFGQTHVKPHHGHGHALQKGSVAERVMLFEKCPEKTSVTKHKLNELQRNRITNPNKIGFWSKFTDTPAPATTVNDKTTANEKSAKNLKIANTSTNVTGSVTGSATAVISLDNDNNNNKLDGIDNAHIASSTIINNNKRNEDDTKLSSSATAALTGSISLIPTFRRLSRSNSLTGTVPPGQLPQFYYPLGRPYSSHEIETQIKRIQTVFERYPSRTVNAKEFAQVLKLCRIPLYWKEPLFRSVLADSKNTTISDESSTITANNTVGLKRTTSVDANSQPKNGILVNGNNNNKEIITCDKFINYWKRLISNCYDDASRFIKILTQGQRNFIIPEDFEPLIQDVIDTHPGLLFLKEAEEFHSRYVHTVIARIFYCVDRKWSGTITLPELKKSNLLRVIQLLEEEEDINQITEYFSYEHFYVIYCKFWELDQDHDLFISKYDLSRHNDSAISSRMIDRIFSGAVTRTARTRKNQMSYTDFVWFLLADEDKRHPKAIEYWFRCMDMDGDGYLSMYELEYFYSEQVKRMEANGIEALPFTDCLCQMIDLISPNDPSRITLSDLKNCRLTPIFFDTFFNLVKYLDHEQRDPFASQREEDGVSMSDWDRYAAEEYEMLVAEESAQNTKYFTTSSMAMETISEPDNDYDNREYCNWQTNKRTYDYDEEESDVKFVEIMSDDDDDQFSNSETEFDDDDDDEVADDEEEDDPNVERMYILVEPVIKENFRANNLLNGFKEMPKLNRSLDSNNNENNEIIERSINSAMEPNQTCLTNNQQNGNMEINNDIDDIGKEFYDYIKMEFESSTSISSLLSSSSSSTSSRSGKVQSIQLIKRDPINKIIDPIDRKSPIKNNHYLTYEDDDDDDFY